MDVLDIFILKIVILLTIIGLLLRNLINVIKYKIIKF